MITVMFNTFTRRVQYYGFRLESRRVKLPGASLEIYRTDEILQICFVRVDGWAGGWRSEGSTRANSCDMFESETAKSDNDEF
jgi:hypothetical protein